MELAPSFRCNSKRRERRSVKAQLNALLFVRIVVKTVYFVATKLFIRLKRLTTVVTFKGIRRLTSSNVAPHFRVCDSFFLISHSHSLTRLKINASFEFLDRQDFFWDSFTFDSLALSSAHVLRTITRVLGMANYRDKKYRRFGCCLIVRNGYAKPSFFN